MNDDMASRLCEFPTAGPRGNKSDDGVERTRLKILNYLSTHAPFCTYFVKPQTVVEDTNAHVFCEFEVFRKLVDEYEKSPDKWAFPRRVMIFEDGGPVNKSNARLMFLALLVQLKVIDEVVVVNFTVGARPPRWVHVRALTRGQDTRTGGATPSFP